MKKHFTQLFILVLALAWFCVPAHAAAKSHITNTVYVKSDYEIPQASAPRLVIEAYDYHPSGGDLAFELTLSGAEWLYSGTVSYAPGISFKVITDSVMMVYVDAAYSPQNNDISVPLYSRITSGGNISVSLSGAGSNIDSATYTYALSGDGPLTFDISERASLKSQGELGTLTINDNSNLPRESGTKMKLALGNGFKFSSSSPAIKGAGKFESGNLLFALDPSDNSVAYITVVDSTEAGTGSITLTNLEISPGKNSAYSGVTLSLSCGGYSQTNTVANYIKVETAAIPISIKSISDSARPVIEGVGSPGETIAVFIDGKKIESLIIPSDGTWKAEYPLGITALSLGSHEARAGKYRESTGKLTDYTAQTFEVTGETAKDAPWEGKTVVFAIGADYYLIDGVKYALESPAFIDGASRTMLPLRTLAETLGAAGLSWDDGTKTATLENFEGNTISITAGESFYKINGIRKDMDTAAVIINDRAYLPVRAMAGAMGIPDESVLWSASAKTVTIRPQDNGAEDDAAAYIKEGYITTANQYVTLVLKNPSFTETYTYGENMLLERKTDNAWTAVTMLNAAKIPETAYELGVLETREQRLLLREYYGNLPAGSYRVTKTLEKLGGGTAAAAAEFRIN